MACRKALSRTGGLEERCGAGVRIYLCECWGGHWFCVQETKFIWSHDDPSWCSSTLFTDYMDPTMSPNLSGSYCPFIGLDKETNLRFSLTVQTMLLTTYKNKLKKQSYMHMNAYVKYMCVSVFCIYSNVRSKVLWEKTIFTKVKNKNLSWLLRAAPCCSLVLINAR